MAGTNDIFVDFDLNGTHKQGALVAVTDQFQAIRRLVISAGRYFDNEDYASHSKVCLVTDDINRRACQANTCLGERLEIGEFRCTVIGEFREGTPTFGESEIQNETVLVPFPLLREINGDDYFQVLYAQARTRRDVAPMTQDIQQVLQSRHSPTAVYRVDQLGSILQAAQSVSTAMTAVLLSVAALAMLIAGVGITNVMLVNVAERQREIGLRKALGATLGEIRLQFLLEAVFISFTGAFAGVGLACFTTAIASHWLSAYLSVPVPYAAIVIAVFASIAVGTFAGYHPASQAATMEPIGALRGD